jgi:hypothetical protein
VTTAPRSTGTSPAFADWRRERVTARSITRRRSELIHDGLPLPDPPAAERVAPTVLGQREPVFVRAVRPAQPTRLFVNPGKRLRGAG